MLMMQSVTLKWTVFYNLVESHKTRSRKIKINLAS